MDTQLQGRAGLSRAPCGSHVSPHAPAVGGVYLVPLASLRPSAPEQHCRAAVSEGPLGRSPRGRPPGCQSPAPPRSPCREKSRAHFPEGGALERLTQQTLAQTRPATSQNWAATDLSLVLQGRQALTSGVSVTSQDTVLVFPFLSCHMDFSRRKGKFKYAAGHLKLALIFRKTEI